MELSNALKDGEETKALNRTAKTGAHLKLHQTPWNQSFCVLICALESRLPHQCLQGCRWVCPSGWRCSQTGRTPLLPSPQCKSPHRPLLGTQTCFSSPHDLNFLRAAGFKGWENKLSLIWSVFTVLVLFEEQTMGSSTMWLTCILLRVQKPFSWLRVTESWRSMAVFPKFWMEMETVTGVVTPSVCK